MGSDNRDSYTVENLLTEADFSPSPSFRAGLHERLAARLASIEQEAAPREQSNGSRPVGVAGKKWRLALVTSLAGLAVLAGLVGLVPAVQARVVDLLRHFGVNLPFAGAGLVISPFTPLAPADVPEDINFFFSLNLDTGVINYIELRYFNRRDFIVVYETPVAEGMTYPAGEDVKVGPYDGVLTRQHGGMVLLAAPGPQPWRPGGSGGGGGGGGAGEAPPMLGYETAVQITWVQDGMWIELLTNLPEEEALRLAVSMQPAPELREK